MKISGSVNFNYCLCALSLYYICTSILDFNNARAGRGSDTYYKYLTGFSVKWCKVVQSGVNTRLVVIFTYGRTLGWSQNPLPVGQRLKTVSLSTFLPPVGLAGQGA